MDKIYRAIVVNKQKAIVGFVIAGAVAYFAKFGIDIETLTVKEAIELIVYGVIGYVAVYTKRNK
jgi:hypothetical protein